MRRHLITMASTALLIGVVPSSAAAQACFHPFSGWVVLEGTLERAVAPGPGAVSTAEARLRRATANQSRAKVSLRRIPDKGSPQAVKARAVLARTASVASARAAELRLLRAGARGFTLRVGLGLTGSGHLGPTSYRFDTPCHFQKQTGRPLRADTGLRVTVRSTRATKMAAVSRDLIRPRVGHRISVTLSQVPNMRRIGAGRLRALTNWG
ncbi:hypothetical protein [Miltoncostaea oceani]|uniref:hypothetical protein n=1 Tax=Miltoncostaea oceani TaxID=2843216 RepID=UPI001C3D961D|nr:hypothetical protein [Miltoncostaea oceani]